MQLSMFHLYLMEMARLDFQLWPSGQPHRRDEDGTTRIATTTEMTDELLIEVERGDLAMEREPGGVIFGPPEWSDQDLVVADPEERRRLAMNAAGKADAPWN